MSIPEGLNNLQHFPGEIPFIVPQMLSIISILQVIIHINWRKTAFWEMIQVYNSSVAALCTFPTAANTLN